MWDDNGLQYSERPVLNVLLLNTNIIKKEINGKAIMVG